jgi:KaiC/GvpD/RAD55 family RecA-like ATPase
VSIIIIIKTGIEGFDSIIEGGLLQGRQYLVSGSPGSGKTTLSVQFLAAGAIAGEPGAYIAFSESVETIKQKSKSVVYKKHGCFLI